MDERIKQIADHYGLYNQTQKCCEECAELIQAICKFRSYVDKFPGFSGEERKETAQRQHVIEEMADVGIMLEQIKYLLGISDEELDKEMQRKVNRQIKRIEELKEAGEC